MERILVIEDDRSVQKALKRLFESENYAVQIAADGNTGLESFRSAPPDLVILDLNLPGKPGREVCREIKRDSPLLPLIVLSARTDVTDKVLLLELGADDYVTKPFSPKELLARVHTAMRRSSRPVRSGDQFSFDDIAVDFSRMVLTRAGKTVALTMHEFKLLKFFVDNPERVASRDDLLNQVWGYDNYPSTRTVDNYVLKLRQKLEKNPTSPIHFLTVHSAGYKFVP
jgi:DNA-binding response OmpR family regulator